MWIPFYLENAHFAINLFMALVVFAVFWLYWDAWQEKKPRTELPKLIGLALLALSFVVEASHVEAAALSTKLLTETTYLQLMLILRTPGYLLVMVGLIVDKLQPHPEMEGYKKPQAPTAVAVFGTMGLYDIAPSIFPILAGIVAFLYLRRATVGLENHLKPMAAAFFIISASELLSLAGMFRDAANVSLSRLVAPFGLVWLIEHVVLLTGAILMGRWVWRYLTKRLETQLFMIFTTTTLVIFLLTTVTFTAMLLSSLQQETLRRLATDVKVLTFAIDSKQAELLADAKSVAADARVVEGIENEDTLTLSDIARTFHNSSTLSSLVVVDTDGKVIARGEDVERVGDSLSGDAMVKRALLTESVSSVSSIDGAFAPDVSIRSAAPVVDSDDLVIGAVVATVRIDNAFVDGVKASTGLEAGVYGDTTLAATTIVAPGGIERWVGTIEDDERVITQVFEAQETYAGDITLLSTPYFAAYQPLLDIDGAPVGMLFVGKPQFSVFEAATRSIELTFVVTAVLLLLAVIPARIVSNHITKQLR